MQGARAAYEIVAPLLREEQPELAKKVAGEFHAVDGLLEPYRTGDSFKSYESLDDGDTRTLSRGIDALAEPLSQVPAQIVG